MASRHRRSQSGSSSSSSSTISSGWSTISASEATETAPGTTATSRASTPSSSTKTTSAATTPSTDSIEPCLLLLLQHLWKESLRKGYGFHKASVVASDCPWKTLGGHRFVFFRQVKEALVERQWVIESTLTPGQGGAELLGLTTRGYALVLDRELQEQVSGTQLDAWKLPYAHTLEQHPALLPLFLAMVQQQLLLASTTNSAKTRLGGADAVMASQLEAQLLPFLGPHHFTQYLLQARAAQLVWVKPVRNGDDAQVYWFQKKQKPHQ